MSASQLQTSFHFQLFFSAPKILNLGMRLDETKKVEVLALFMLALCVFDPKAVLSKSVVDVREL